MFTSIEENIVARLNTKLTEPKRVDIDVAHSALAVPAIDVIVGNGSFVRVAQSWKIKPQVFVIVTFQNLRSVADRRRGVYPILLGILSALVDQKLGLKIDGLAPVRLDNITDEKEAGAGKIVYQLEFETGFIIEKLSDEAIVELLSVGLNYYLQDPADDTVVDASDLVTLSTT